MQVWINVHLIQSNDDYSVKRLSITRNKRSWNGIIIPIQPFADDTLIWWWNGQISQNTLLQNYIFTHIGLCSESIFNLL